MAKKSQKGGANLKKRLRIWLPALLVLVAVVALLYFNSTGGAQKGVPNLQPDDHTKGNGPVVLVAYSDFQCSACRTYAPAITQLAQEHGDRVTVVFRYFPLRGAFAHSDLAAQVAQAASRQNRFWPMHDRLFATQPQWAQMADPKALFVDFARQMGLDMKLFLEDLENPALMERIERDRRSGLEAEIRGTPTFFINGEMIETPRSYGEFVDLLEGAAGGR